MIVLGFILLKEMMDDDDESTLFSLFVIIASFS